MFEKAIDICHRQSENKLIHISVYELLHNFLKESGERRNKYESIDKVEKSGHADLIKAFYM